MQLNNLCQEIAPEITTTVPVAGLSLSSKEVQPGDIFVALSGQKHHGMQFAEQAVANGASAILFETDQAIKIEPKTFDIPCVAVDNLSQKLSALAARFYGDPSSKLTVCAITGTNGKSSIAYGLAAIVQASLGNAGLVGTVGYGRHDDLQAISHTTPDAIALQKILVELVGQGVSYLAMEASSHGLELGRMNAVAVTTAIYTNLSRDHQDFHESMQAYAKAKQRLFAMPQVKHAVVHVNDSFGAELAKTYQEKLRLIRFGIDIVPEGEFLNATQLVQNAHGSQFMLNSSWGDMTIQLPWLGRFNIENCLAIMGGYMLMGGDFHALPALIAQLPDLPGRMQCFGGTQGKPLVVVDYAHTPDALEKALQALREHLPAEAQLYCVFGCGGDRDQGKRPLMAQSAEAHADYIVVTDDNPRSESPEAIIADILTGFSDQANVTVVHERDQAIFAAVHSAKAGDMVLVAGKGHETVQIFADGSQPFNDCEYVEKALC